MQQDLWFKLVVLGELEETGSAVEQCPALGLLLGYVLGVGDVPLTCHTCTLLGAQASYTSCMIGKFQTEAK